MLHIYTNPKSLYFEHKWNLYGHTQSISQTYSSAFVKLSTIKTIADFWCTMNNIPSAYDLHSHQIFMDEKRIVAYSLFKENITPEWEHQMNINGCELGFRDELDVETFSQLWNTFTLSAVNNEIDHVVGIRAINKCNKSRCIYKFEIWLDTVDETHIKYVQDFINKAFGHLVHSFSLMYHHEKQSQANEYTKKKLGGRSGKKHNTFRANDQHKKNV